MDVMQQLFDEHYPSLEIQIIGVNEDGHQSQNTLMVAESERMPWLQDLQSNDRHVWGDLWDVTYRDVQIVDRNGDHVDTYNVTSNNLALTENFNALRDKFIAVAATAPESPWQSPIEPLDTNQDGQVAPVDAIITINALNDGQAGTLPGTPGENDFLVDVTGEGALSPLDPLRIINHLNAVSSVPQAASSSAAVVDNAPTDIVFASYADDVDDDDEE